MPGKDPLSLFGDSDKYSPGLATMMADRQLKRAMEEGTVDVCFMGNAKDQIVERATGKWFLHRGSWGETWVPTCMLGAACGDVAGSVYEWHNIKYKLPADQLIHPKGRFTDDTVMTCAVAEGLRRGLEQVPLEWMGNDAYEQILFDSVRDSCRTFGRKYPWAGYGGRFVDWICSDDPKPYGSWGNGSAMRASYAGWAARSLAEAEKLAEISAAITHDHPDGIKGAQVVAGSIYLLRHGGTKADIRSYASRYYNLEFTLDSIREAYRFDVSCRGSVPQAIVAFLEEESFSDVIAAAISIGGDSDTIAAIAGSIAEVIYPIPQGVRGRVIDRLDSDLRQTLMDAVDFAARRVNQE